MALKNIIGQDKAIGILLRTFERGRIPSSYLFAGESGIGKKLAAINLAKALNCLGRAHGAESTALTDPSSAPPAEGATVIDSLLRAFDSCDECSSCKKIDAAIHPDFLLISPESDQIRIEEIRAVDDILSLKAFEGRYKTVIVDDADTMNQYAANAFLKTLEEPPRNSLIILISSRPDRLPDTIRSRCSRINFTPLSYEACRVVIEKSPSPPDPLTLSLLVRLSMGKPGEAVSGDLIEERTWFMKTLKAMLGMEKDSWASKEDMKKWFDFALILLRDMAIIKIDLEGKDLVNIDRREYIKRLSSLMDLKSIIEYYQRLNTLKGFFNFNLNKALTWNYTGALLRREMDVADA